MEYNVPPIPDNPPINYIDRPQIIGHYSQGGPLPAYLLTQKFDETAGIGDPFAYYDYSRSLLADYRGDAPLFESEEPRSTRAKSQAALNLRSLGTRSGLDAPDHSEICTGFMDADPRIAGDSLVPLWRMKEQSRIRGRYLKPYEPSGSSSLTDAIPDGVEREDEQYKKSREALLRAKQYPRFSRMIEQTAPNGVIGWHHGNSAKLAQIAESGKEYTIHGSRERSEYNPTDEKYSVELRSGSTASSAAAAAVAIAVNAAPGGGMADTTRVSLADAAPVRGASGRRGIAMARILRHRGGIPSVPLVDTTMDSDIRYARAINLSKLAQRMHRMCMQINDTCVATPLADAATATSRGNFGDARRIMDQTIADSPVAREIRELSRILAHGPPGTEPHVEGGIHSAQVDDIVGNSFIQTDASLILAARDHMMQSDSSVIIRKTDRDAVIARELRYAATRAAAQIAAMRVSTCVATDVDAVDERTPRHYKGARVRTSQSEGRFIADNTIGPSPAAPEKVAPHMRARSIARDHASGSRIATNQITSEQYDRAHAGGKDAIADSVEIRGEGLVAPSGTITHTIRKSPQHTAIFKEPKMGDEEIRD